MEEKYTGIMASLYMLASMFLTAVEVEIFKLFSGDYSLQRLLLARYFAAIILNSYIIEHNGDKVYFTD